MPASARQLGVEQRGALLVEAGVRLVEQHEVGLVQERPAEREPLLHPAGEGRHPLAPGLPEAVALEQHPDPLAPLGDAVEAAVEVEVLERGQLPVDERLVGEVADAAALDVDLELAAVGASSPAQSASSVDFPEPFGPGDEQEVALGDVEVEVAEDALRPEAPAEAARRDHTTTSASTKRKNVTLMTPFIVKKAMSRPARVPRGDERVLVARSPATRRRRASRGRRRRARARRARGRRPWRRGSAGDRERRGTPKRAGTRVEAVRAVVLEVEERVEDVEAGDPDGDGGAEQPGLERQLVRDRRPGADRREPVDGAEPEVREPGRPLQVRVDDEGRDGDRPEPADDRRELVDGDEEDRERGEAEEHDLPGPERAARELPAGGARVARVDAGVDQPVERHRQAARADHRHRDPEEVGGARDAVDGEERADVGEREREDRVLELDEREEELRVAEDASALMSGGGRSARRRGARARGRARAAAPRSRRGRRRASRGG